MDANRTRRPPRPKAKKKPGNRQAVGRNRLCRVPRYEKSIVDDAIRLRITVGPQRTTSYLPAVNRCQTMDRGKLHLQAHLRRCVTIGSRRKGRTIAKPQCAEPAPKCSLEAVPRFSTHRQHTGATNLQPAGPPNTAAQSSQPESDDSNEPQEPTANRPRACKPQRFRNRQQLTYTHTQTI